MVVEGLSFLNKGIYITTINNYVHQYIKLFLDLKKNNYFT